MFRRKPDEAPTDQPKGVAAPGVPVLLGPDGFSVGDRARSIPYRDITHIGVARRGLAIATPRDLIVIRRGQFASDESMEWLGSALMDRIGRGPGGGEQLARMAEIDRLARRSHPRRATLAFVLICLVVGLVQWKDPFLQRAGSFAPDLVAAGEMWRIVTANFIHEVFFYPGLDLFVPAHLLINVICIGAFGRMVERLLGFARTLAVMGLSALGAMFGCVLAGYSDVVGASGVAAGLVGALLAIELRVGRRLPSFWRIPRRLFLTALVLQAAVDVTVPAIAAAAHVGGFLTGYGVAWSMSDSAGRGRPLGPVRLAVVGAMVAAAVLAFIALTPLAGRSSGALERHAIRLLHTMDLSAHRDNEVAWLIATETQPSELALQAAAALAERAVLRSRRTDPDILDTLAEIRFMMGDVLGALDAIDEAIGISGEPYFIEQRRRFTGERAFDDRPRAPSGPRSLRDPDAIPEAPGPFDDAEGVWI